ncbi:Uncharacterised protein [Streptococcus pneumoniae]|nr:Uncharacterised protein [Streptococcus pneumoniae]
MHTLLEKVQVDFSICIGNRCDSRFNNRWTMNTHKPEEGKGTKDNGNTKVSVCC